MPKRGIRDVERVREMFRRMGLFRLHSTRATALLRVGANRTPIAHFVVCPVPMAAGVELAHSHMPSILPAFSPAGKGQEPCQPAGRYFRGWVRFWLRSLCAASYCVHDKSNRDSDFIRDFLVLYRDLRRLGSASSLGRRSSIAILCGCRRAGRPFHFWASFWRVRRRDGRAGNRAPPERI